MSDLVIIVGLPASGKTTYAKNNYPDYVLYDDVSISFISPYELLGPLERGQKIVIADPYLCHKASQVGAKSIFKNHNPSWVYFENNPSQCLINAANRLESESNKKVKEFIKILSKKYFIPDGATVIPVYRSNRTQV